MRKRKEVIHKARIRDFTTYESAKHEMGKFLLRVIEDTWIHELKRAKTYYTLVTVGKFLTHLQATCGGLHALDVITLKHKLEHYHIKSEGIPKYINKLEDAQAKYERSNNPITNVMLVIIATNTMIITEKLPCSRKY